METIYIIALSLGSLLTIFILTKLMGYRQMSQMSMFDYTNGITIGSLAAQLPTSLEDDFTRPLMAMIVYGVSTFLISVLSNKFVKVRRIIEGKPLILLNNGELYRKNLRKAKIDVSEFLEQCREQGYFDVSKLETAILEGNGRISFLPKAADRPLTPSDVNLAATQDFMVANVILDGRIMSENLKNTGNDEKWLISQIKGQGAKRVEDVLLATCDATNKVTVFMKENKKKDPDILI